MLESETIIKINTSSLYCSSGSRVLQLYIRCTISRKATKAAASLLPCLRAEAKDGGGSELEPEPEPEAE